MREILFRGKDISGKWHYGVPLMFNEDYVCIAKLNEHNKTVEYKTLGQYTGLTDKNGKKIFEGDICAIVGEEKEIIKDDIFVVSWEENCGFNLYTCFDYEIIGNIYDNPEWLKEAVQE